jgi:pyrroline-5-carboxylate reductase
MPPATSATPSAASTPAPLTPGAAGGAAAALAGRRLALVGAGTMGNAIAGGLARAGVFPGAALAVVDRHGTSAAALAGQVPGARGADLVAACRDADVVLLCVKPRDVAGVLEQLAAAGALERAGGERAPLLVSIAAGVRTAAIEGALAGATGGPVPVVRAMPNTASAIGRGCTVLSAGAHAGAEHLALARAVFGCVGTCLELDERHLDAVTAVSASGPAFIYVVLEALTDGAVSCGLPRAAATELVTRMTLGAAEMVLATGRHPAALKDDVTTPGGCTIAGLLVLEDGRARSVLARTIETTARVAGELSR